MRFFKNKNLNKHCTKRKQILDTLRAKNLCLKKSLKQKEKEINLLKEKYNNLKQSNKTKLEYITYLSHEFKTPLNAIIGFTSLIQEQEIPREKELKFLDNILKASRHLLKLTTYTTDMSKAETDKLKLNYSEFAPNEQIYEIIEILEEKLTQKHIKLTLNLTDISIIADKLRFKQLVYNFVGNAIKYNRLGGEIEITTSVCNSNYYFEIRDTGKGIPKAEQDKIFEFFSDIDKYNYKKQNGTGIGLSLSKKIINLHRGEIKFSSKENEGTIFRFSLPLKSSAMSKFHDIREISRNY